MTIQHEVVWELVSPHTSITYNTTKEELTWADHIRGKTARELVTSFTWSYTDPDDSRWDKQVTVAMEWPFYRTMEQIDTSIYHYELLSAIPSRLAKNIIKSMDEQGRWVETDYGDEKVGDGSSVALWMTDTKTGQEWKAKCSYSMETTLRCGMLRHSPVYTLESPIGLSEYDKSIITVAMFNQRQARKRIQQEHAITTSHQHLQRLYGDN